MKPRSFGENLSIMQTVHDGIYRDMLVISILFGFPFYIRMAYERYVYV